MDCNINFNVWQDNIFWLDAKPTITFQDILLADK